MTIDTGMVSGIIELLHDNFINRLRPIMTILSKRLRHKKNARPYKNGYKYDKKKSQAYHLLWNSGPIQSFTSSNTSNLVYYIFP